MQAAQRLRNLNDVLRLPGVGDQEGKAALGVGLGIREHGDSVTRSGGLYLQADALELGIARNDI